MQLSCYIHRNPLRAGIVERLADYRWSSYKVYAYGHKAPKWLSTRLILSQFKSEDSHKAYREKVQGYAKEEKQLWEDLRHGIVLGTQNFVDKIRSAYLPEKPHREIPQQRDVAKGIDPVALLSKAARIIDCDLTRYKESQRITKSDKNDRDLLVFFVWKTGLLTNEAIGQLFGVTYSSISHIVKSIKSRLKKDRRLNEKFDRIYSQFKI